MTNNNADKHRFSFSAFRSFFCVLSLKSWVIILVAGVVCGVGIWESIKPYLAERYYRDGFNLAVNAEHYLKGNRNDLAVHRYTYAIQDLEKAVAYAPWETQYISELGKSMEGLASATDSPNEKRAILEKVIPLYERNIELDSQNPWFYNRLATVYSQLLPLLSAPNERQAVIDKMDLLIRESALADPQNPLFQLNYAYYLHRNNRIEEAIPLYERALSYDGRLSDAAANLGDIYSMKTDYLKAANYYLMAYKQNPDTHRIRYKLAAVYIQLGQHDDALVYLKEAYELNPYDRDLARNYVAILHETKKWEAAVGVYQSIFSTFDDMDNLHPFYVQALVNSGRLSEAQQALKIRIKTHPNDQEARRQLSKINAYLASPTR